MLFWENTGLPLVYYFSLRLIGQYALPHPVSILIEKVTIVAGRIAKVDIVIVSSTHFVLQNIDEFTRFARSCA